MSVKNAVYVYDFTKYQGSTLEIKTILIKYCKKWDFQLEECPTTKKEHYQGRFHLMVKKREGEVIKLLGGTLGHITTTNTKAIKDSEYVMKEDTRLEGPWSSTDEIIYIPKQIREISVLRTWQEQIKSKVNVWDTRSINFVHCPLGNIGKSTLIGYLRAHRLARVLPFCNDYKDILRMVCDMPTSRCYLLDMPRAIKKDKLFQFFSAIETIKDGYAYDDRYHFKEKVFDCPNIWIFSNMMPDLSLLSKDRWLIWEVDENDVLVPKPEETDELDNCSTD